MTLPPWERIINHRKYHRTGVHTTSKTIATKQADELREGGFLARAIKNDNGYWSTYFAEKK